MAIANVPEQRSISKTQMTVETRNRNVLVCLTQDVPLFFWPGDNITAPLAVLKKTSNIDQYVKERDIHAYRVRQPTPGHNNRCFYPEWPHIDFLAHLVVLSVYSSDDF